MIYDGGKALCLSRSSGGWAKKKCHGSFVFDTGDGICGDRTSSGISRFILAASFVRASFSLMRLCRNLTAVKMK